MQNPNSLMQWRIFHLATISHIRTTRERALVEAFTETERAWFRRPLGAR